MVTGNRNIRSGKPRHWLTVLYLFILLLAIVPLVTLWQLPRLGQWALNAYLVHAQVDQTEVTIAAWTPWRLQLSPIRYQDPEWGVSFELGSAELNYSPRELLTRHRAESLNLEKGLLTLDLDVLRQRLERDRVLSPAPESGTGIPPILFPLSRLQGEDMVIQAVGGDRRLVANIHLLGTLKNETRWDQNLSLDIHPWQLKADIWGSLDRAGDADWEISGQGVWPDPLGALSDWVPEWNAILPDRLLLQTGPLHWEAQSEGNHSGIRQSVILFDLGAGRGVLDALQLQFEGLAGAAHFPGMDPFKGNLRLHGRVNSLTWGDLLVTRAFAIELNRESTGAIGGRVGPLALRFGPGEFLGKLEMRGVMDHMQIPAETQLRVEAEQLRFQNEFLETGGRGNLTLSMEQETEGWMGQGQFQLNFPSGRWNQVYLNDLEVNGDLKTSRPPSSWGVLLPNEVEADGKADGDPPFTSFLETEMSGAIAINLREVALPGQGRGSGLSLHLERPQSSTGEKPLMLASAEVEQGSFRSMAFRNLQLEGRLNRDEGTVNLSLEPVGGNLAEASLQFEEESGQDAYRWKAELSPWELSGTRVMGILGSQWENTLLGGVIHGEAAGIWDEEKGWNGSGQIQARQFSLSDEELDLEVNGARINVNLSSMNPMASEKGQILAVDSFRKGRLEGVDLETRFQIVDPGHIAVEGSRASLFGGEVRFDSFQWNTTRPDVRLVIHLQNIEVAQFMEMVDDFPGTLEGRINGKIRLRWDGREFHFGRSYLEMVPETEGQLRLNLDRRPVDPSAPAYDFLSNLAQTQAAVESLRHVRVEQLRFDLFNPDQPRNPTQARIKGVSLSIRPMAPLDLTVNLGGDVEESLRQLMRFLLGTR